MFITGSQIRAARALLKWSAEKLATESHIGRVTITRAESTDAATNLTKANIDALRRTLEAAGVEFIAENGGGVGVRFKNVSFTGTPDALDEGS